MATSWAAGSVARGTAVHPIDVGVDLIVLTPTGRQVAGVARQRRQIDSALLGELRALFVESKWPPITQRPVTIAYDEWSLDVTPMTATPSLPTAAGTVTASAEPYAAPRRQGRALPHATAFGPRLRPPGPTHADLAARLVARACRRHGRLDVVLDALFCAYTRIAGWREPVTCRARAHCRTALVGALTRTAPPLAA